MPSNRPATDAKVDCATWMSFYLNLRVIAVSIFANYQPLTLLTASLPRAAAPLTWSGTETTAARRAALRRPRAAPRRDALRPPPRPLHGHCPHWRWMEPARPRRAPEGRATAPPRPLHGHRPSLALDGTGSPAPRPRGTRYGTPAPPRDALRRPRAVPPHPLHGHRPSLALDGTGSPAPAPRRDALRRLRAPFTGIAHHWRWMEPARPRRTPEGRATPAPTPRRDALYPCAHVGHGSGVPSAVHGHRSGGTRYTAR